ncbi:unnamed protein product [Sphenostylis stenocarpa]|uniref:Uncharacterized protein n=1 Tax=Sphenostylis stenocarpa TaxID=92480 RepID=A0AA86VIC3_9FABA|nr:unnamed protein product [Sphenostylis stenocarpa]
MLDNTLTQLPMVNVNRVYIHKDDAPHMADGAQDFDDEDMLAIDVPATGTSSASHSSSHPSMEDMLFDIVAAV